MIVARDHSSPYDLELPILAELAAELELELRALDGPAPRASFPRRVGTTRILTRALILVALVSLVGGSALAGRSVLAGSRRSNTGPVVLSQGGRGPERWQLQVYLHAKAVCYALFVADTVSSACGGPAGSAGVRVTSALGPTRRFVAGLARASVADVLVRVGGRTLLTPTHPESAAAGARRSGLPTGLRWFLASLPDKQARRAPASLTPRNRAGRDLGPAVLDCSLAGASGPCQRAAAALGEVPGHGPR